MRMRAKQFEGSEVMGGKQAILGRGSAAWLVTDQSNGSGPTTVRPVMTWGLICPADATGRQASCGQEREDGV